MSHIDSWKNRNIFDQQLNLNLKELSSYPQHWKDFVYIVKNNTTASGSMLDIGCGCGTYYELCKREFPSIIYTGIDYSIDAIDIAKNYWKYDQFYTKDFWSLDKEYIKQFDLLHCGALFDVLPNADEALNYLLDLKPSKIIIGRMKLTNDNSYYTEYMAYDSVQTYCYFHNIKIVQKLFLEYNYKYFNINDTIFLELNNVYKR